MKIYHYNRDTKEFLSSGKATPDPLEPGRFLVPADATFIPPPAIPTKKAATFDGTAWGLAEDHRGTFIYSLATGDEATVTGLGPIDPLFTTVKPIPPSPPPPAPPLTKDERLALYENDIVFAALLEVLADRFSVNLPELQTQLKAKMP